MSEPARAPAPESVEPSARPASAFQQIVLSTRTLLEHKDLRVVLLLSTIIGLGASFVMPFLPMFMTMEVGMSLGEFGWFMTASALANIVIATAIAHRSDTMVSRRGLLLAGSAAGVLAYLGYAWVRDPWGLLAIATLILGIASVTYAQMFAHARDLVDRSNMPAAHAPLYLSTIRMCFALSWTVGPALAAATLDRTSFQGLFLAASALYAVFFVIVLNFVREERELRATSKPSAPKVPVLGLLRRPVILAWFAAFVLVFAAHTLAMNNMALYVLKELDGDASHVGAIFSLAPLFELPFMLYFGLLATRIDSTRLIRAAVALAIVYYALVSLARAPWHIYPLQLLSAAIVAVTGGVAISFFQDKLPGQAGAATNLYTNAVRIGSTSGYLLFGATAARFGHRGAYVACGLLAVLALALTLPRGSRAEPAA
jgi:SET family sugar efflux transporter-like MFS transporter